ncbi:MAG TPA: hypothetical protein VHB79_35645 [Polyangiaceae bacterium]|nr:hypothetical protein [Polyangiaceae bacterium]
MTAVLARIRAKVAGRRPLVRKSCARARAAWLLVTAWGLVACGSDSAGSTVSPPPAPSGSGAPGLSPLGRARCQAPAGVDASPKNIDEAVELLNALPKPTSVACFVESLARPLNAYATSSPFSAQPALSPKSPRLFLQLDELWLSVVIDGDSSYLMEFGLLIDTQAMRSIKGELKLPLDAPVAPSTPFDRVRYDSGTVCGLCHLDEHQETSVSFAAAFSSNAFRPRPDSRVGIDGLRLENQLCDWHAEPHRCEMLSAVFDGGPVSEIQFPAEMRTFF